MTATTTVCLKGRIHEFGPSLELPAARDVLYVGRPAYQGGWRLPGSIWANPYRAQDVGGAARAVEMYAAWLPEQAELMRRLPELCGKRLGCWCAEGSPCHRHYLRALVDRLTAAPGESPRKRQPLPDWALR